MFGGTQWFFWSGFGLIFAFLTTYFQRIGFTSIEIGLVTGTASVVSLVGQLVLGMISDRIGSAGRVLQSSLIASVVLALVMFVTPPVLFAVAAVTFLLAFSTQTLPPILDGWAMQVRERVPRLDYGITRSMGSIGFAVTSATAGIAYDRWGISMMFPAAAVMFALTAGVVAIVRRLHTIDERAASETAPTPSPDAAVDPAEVPPAGIAPDELTTAEHDSPVKRFFTFRMVVLLSLGFLTFASFRPVQVFIPLLFDLVGGTNRHIGYAYSVMAVSEFPFLIAFTFLIARFEDTRIIMIAFVFFFFRVFVHLFVPTPTIVIIAQVFQGPSFGLFLPAWVHLLNRLAPRGARTFAQTVGSVATFGLGSMAGSAAGGYLIEWFGLRGMYAITSATMALVVLAFVLLFVTPGPIAVPRARVP